MSSNFVLQEVENLSLQDLLRNVRRVLERSRDCLFGIEIKLEAVEQIINVLKYLVKSAGCIARGLQPTLTMLSERDSRSIYNQSLHVHNELDNCREILEIELKGGNLFVHLRELQVVIGKLRDNLLAILLIITKRIGLIEIW